MASGGPQSTLKRRYRAIDSFKEENRISPTDTLGNPFKDGETHVAIPERKGAIFN